MVAAGRRSGGSRAGLAVGPGEALSPSLGGSSGIALSRPRRSPRACAAAGRTAEAGTSLLPIHARPPRRRLARRRTARLALCRGPRRARVRRGPRPVRPRLAVPAVEPGPHPRRRGTSGVVVAPARAAGCRAAAAGGRPRAGARPGLPRASRRLGSHRAHRPRSRGPRVLGGGRLDGGRRAAGTLPGAGGREFLVRALLVAVAAANVLAVTGWLAWSWGPSPFLGLAVLQILWSLAWRQRFRAATAGVRRASRDLNLIASLLEVIEREPFEGTRLIELAEAACGATTASQPPGAPGNCSASSTCSTRCATPSSFPSDCCCSGRLSSPTPSTPGVAGTETGSPSGSGRWPKSKLWPASPPMRSRTRTERTRRWWSHRRINVHCSTAANSGIRCCRPRSAWRTTCSLPARSGRPTGTTCK